LLRLNILSVDFHPFFMTGEGDIDAAKIRAFRFLSKHWMINHAVLYPLVLFGARARVCVCVCVCLLYVRDTYAIRSYFCAHMRHWAVYLLLNENSSTSKTGEKPSWVIGPVLDLVVPRCFILKSNISNLIGQYF